MCPASSFWGLCVECLKDEPYSQCTHLCSISLVKQDLLMRVMICKIDNNTKRKVDKVSDLLTCSKDQWCKKMLCDGGLDLIGQV